MQHLGGGTEESRAECAGGGCVGRLNERGYGHSAERVPVSTCAGSSKNLTDLMAAGGGKADGGGSTVVRLLLPNPKPWRSTLVLL